MSTDGAEGLTLSLIRDQYFHNNFLTTWDAATLSQVVGNSEKICENRCYAENYEPAASA